MQYRVTIRRVGRRSRSNKHWWIRCPVCRTKSHVQMHRWASAIRMADIHVNGRQHTNNLKKLKEGATSWLATTPVDTDSGTLLETPC